jgi:LuxR family transcriptional regulator, maltose regulon positive regulatory protein
MAMANAKLGEFDTAEADLELPEHRMKSIGSHYFEVMTAFTRAVIAYGRHDVPQGDRHLRTAVTVAEREGFRHLHPTWSPAFFSPLLDRALEVGIRTDWVTQLIRQQEIAAPPDAVAWPHRVVVQLLGDFDILIDGVSAWRAGRMPKRAVELIALLALAGHRAVPVSTVIDQLWPDADGDLAKGSLEATLHRARKALDEPRRSRRGRARSASR